MLRGAGAELVDGLGRYREAGADQINIAVRAPFDLRVLDVLGEGAAAR